MRNYVCFQSMTRLQVLHKRCCPPLEVTTFQFKFFFACQIILRVGRKLAKLPASNRLSLNVCRLSIYYYQNTKRSFLTNIFHCTELCTAAYLDKWGWKALPFPFENHVNGKMDKVPLVYTGSFDQFHYHLKAKMLKKQAHAMLISDRIYGFNNFLLI